MVGAQENPLFLVESRILRGREGINLLVQACRSQSLSFFSLFLFLNTYFLFSGFEIPNPLILVSPLYMAKDSLYSACRDRILLF